VGVRAVGNSEDEWVDRRVCGRAGNGMVRCVQRLLEGWAAVGGWVTGNEGGA
jgi:hypothetical protein